MYKTKQVYKITNIPAGTLRNWELRYGLIKPLKNNNGQRLYSDSDIELLIIIVAHLKTGKSIGDIARSVKNGEKLILPNSSDQTVNILNVQIIERFYRALISMDLNELNDCMGQIEISFDVSNRLELIYYTCLARLGDDWSQGKINITTEHFASNYIRGILYQIMRTSKYEICPKRPFFICATPTNELHDGGLLLIGSELRIRCQNVMYLGTSLPAGDLKLICKRMPHCILLLSITDPKLVVNTINEFQDFICPVYIGGRGILLSERLANRIGKIHFINLVGKNAVDRIIALASKHYLKN